jgi:hypothetical protein
MRCAGPPDYLPHASSGSRLRFTPASHKSQRMAFRSFTVLSHTHTHTHTHTILSLSLQPFYFRLPCILLSRSISGFPASSFAVLFPASLHPPLPFYFRLPCILLCLILSPNFLSLLFPPLPTHPFLSPRSPSPPLDSQAPSDTRMLAICRSDFTRRFPVFCSEKCGDEEGSRQVCPGDQRRRACRGSARRCTGRQAA